MNIEWDDVRSKLKLDNEQTIIIKYLLNRLKDHFTGVYETEAVDYELSPVEYLADLKLSIPELDVQSIKKNFIDYIAKEKKLDTNLTYQKICEKLDISTKDEINRLLNEEQKKISLSFKLGTLLDINTGYDPFHDKVIQQIARIEEIRRRNINTFCSIPFEYAFIDDTGDVYPCCPSKFKLSIGNLIKDSLTEVWNSKASMAVRKSIVDRTFRYCDYEACEYLKGGQSKHGENADRDVLKDNKALDLQTINRVPGIINLAYDRTCNLSCSYCRTGIHSSKQYLIENTARIHHNIFGEKLHGVQRLIISGNGDPCASRFYMDLLQNFDQKKYANVKIKIQTNGLLLTPEKWNSIPKSHSAIDWITVSIDAAEAETYKINRGGNFEKLLKNLEFVSELRKSNKIKLFFINFVVQANNYKEMKQFVELGFKYKCDLVEFQCIENWGTYSPHDFKKVAIHDKSHPEHKEFLKVLEDPIFTKPIVCVYKLLDFIPDNVRKKLITQGNIIKYDNFGEGIKL